MTRTRRVSFAACALFATLLPCASTATTLANARPNDGLQAHATSDVWRLSGRLLAGDGRAFAYSVAFFRFASARGPELYPAAASIVDETTQRRISERRTERGSLGLAGASSGRLGVHVGDWSLRESDSNDARPAFDLRVRLADGSLDLHGVARKPRIALDGNDHYAYTSIATSGTVAFENARSIARGTSWLDRETGDAAAPQPGVHFERYRVALDDGREIFVEASGGGHDTRRRAFLVRRDGTLETLVPKQYEFGTDGGTTWRSTHTRARYPDLWALHVDGETEYLSLEPVMLDQEATAGGNGASFWDGAVDVYDVTPSSEGRRLGSGFVMLAGYDGTSVRR